MDIQATPRQIGLLQHTLGLSAENRVSHRNHFVAGNDHHDMPDLQLLEKFGLMRRASTPAFLPAGDIVFCVTEAGRSIASAALPLPRDRTRYEDFLDYDGGMTFGQYLCGDKLPAFERKQDWNTVHWRMVRRMHGVVDVAGQWATTKKAAKASYKLALAERLRQGDER